MTNGNQYQPFTAIAAAKEGDDVQLAVIAIASDQQGIEPGSSLVSQSEEVCWSDFNEESTSTLLDRARALLNTNESIGRLRGRFHEFYPSGAPMVGEPVPQGGVGLSVGPARLGDAQAAQTIRFAGIQRQYGGRIQRELGREVIRSIRLFGDLRQ